MRITISLDGRLLHDADEAARRMGSCRSSLFTLAIADFLQRQRQDDMLRRLNEIYSEAPKTDEKRLLKGIRAKVRLAVADSWQASPSKFQR